MKIKSIIIEVMGKALEEQGFQYNKKESTGGIWTFTRIVDTSWCVDFPSDSDRAVECIEIQKSNFENRMMLNYGVNAVEDGYLATQQLSGLLFKKYGSGWLYYTDEESLRKVCENFLETSLNDIPSLFYEQEKNSRRYEDKDGQAYFLEHYVEIGKAYEVNCLKGKQKKDALEETFRLLEENNEKAYRNVREIMLGATAYFGNEIIRRQSGEWVPGPPWMEIRQGDVLVDPYKLFIVIWRKMSFAEDCKKELIKILSY